MTLQSSVDFATTMLRDMNIEHRIRLIETRDAAVRADQARRDAAIARTICRHKGECSFGMGPEVIANRIECRAGIGKEKGDAEALDRS